MDVFSQSAKVLSSNNVIHPQTFQKMIKKMCNVHSKLVQPNQSSKSHFRLPRDIIRLVAAAAIFFAPPKRLSHVSASFSGLMEPG